METTNRYSDKDLDKLIAIDTISSSTKFKIEVIRNKK